MSIRHVALITAALAALTGCATQNKWTVSPEQRAANSPSLCLLSPFVRNTDGSIDNAQVQAGIDAAFARDDLNHDGKLTYDEISIVNQARQGTCDTTSLVSWNGTGSIDRAEYGARYETAFLAADRNADGYASAAELAAPVSATERAYANAKRASERKATAESANTDETPAGLPGRSSTGITNPSGPPGY